VPSHPNKSRVKRLSVSVRAPHRRTESIVVAATRKKRLMDYKKNNVRKE
jgi:hypothetical protein